MPRICYTIVLLLLVINCSSDKNRISNNNFELTPTNPDLKVENSTIIIAAGVPKPLGETEDFNLIFSTLQTHLISSFFPTFQYSELPPLSLGLETKFIPPYSETSISPTVFSTTKTKLILPGGLLYPTPPTAFPTIDQDPLQQVIDFYGRENILAITNYDEPVGWVSLDSIARKDYPQMLYDRVKQIDPTIPVMMVHAPIIATVDNRDVTQAEVDGYLSSVKHYNQFADIIGFDIYPIPLGFPNITSPYNYPSTGTLNTIYKDYIDWLKLEGNGKPTLMALQGFGYNMFDSNMTEGTDPTYFELQTSLRECIDNDVSYVIWWGQGFITENNSTLWQNILNVSKNRDKIEILPLIQ